MRGIAFMNIAYAVIAIFLGIFVLVNKRQKKKYYAVMAFVFSALGLAFSYGIIRNVDLCFCPQTRAEASTTLPEEQKTSSASTY